MSEYHEREALSTGAQDAYRLHSLFTRISSQADLNPAGANPFPCAVPVNIHEYIHYLHNISTSAGLGAMLGCIFTIPSFVNNSDDRGWYEKNNDGSLEEIKSYAFDFIEMMRGSVKLIDNDKKFSWPGIDDFTFGDERLITINEKEFRALSATIKLGDIYRELVIHPGLDFISEGIAYEIEREQYKLQGVDPASVDKTASSYPYLVYRPFVDHLVGHQTNISERVLIGTYALLSGDISDTFFKLCAALKYDKENNDNYFSETEKIKKKALEFFRKEFDSKLELMRSIFEMSEQLYKGFEIYEKLIKKGFELRLNDHLVELKFVQKSLNSEEFLTISSNMIDRLVLQEKPDENFELTWFGIEGSIVSLDDQELNNLSVLQACVHYLQQHFARNGILAETKQLKETKCPFDGICDVQKKLYDSSECGTKPWNVSVTDGKKGVCFYECARLSLRLNPDR